MAALVLLRLAGLAVEPRYTDAAARSLVPMQPLLARHPLGFGQWLTALDYSTSHPQEVAIVGDEAGHDTQALLEAARGAYRPHQIVALAPPEPARQVAPLLRDRHQVDGQATAYVCVDFTCRRPVTDPQVLRRQLDSGVRDPAADAELQ